jgi:large subunit ribosomal protein L16
MLQPKRSKYRKTFRPKYYGKIAFRGNQLAFGEYGLRSVEAGLISARQIESARRAITNFTKRGGRVYIRIFPDTPQTRKPPETRMGGGKGDILQYVAPVRIGRVLFEMGGVDEATAREALRLAQYKLSVKSVFIAKE